MTPMMTEEIDKGLEMASALEELSSERLAWLVMKSGLQSLAEFSPESILVSELLRRVAPHLDGATITHNGWILSDGRMVSYED